MKEICSDISEKCSGDKEICSDISEKCSGVKEICSDISEKGLEMKNYQCIFMRFPKPNLKYSIPSMFVLVCFGFFWHVFNLHFYVLY